MSGEAGEVVVLTGGPERGVDRGEMRRFRGQTGDDGILTVHRLLQRQIDGASGGVGPHTHSGVAGYHATLCANLSAVIRGIGIGHIVGDDIKLMIDIRQTRSGVRQCAIHVHGRLPFHVNGLL